MTPLNQTLADLTGLRDPLHEQRDVLRELAFAEHDLTILATDLSQALGVTTAGQAEHFAAVFGTYANAFRELETLAMQRAHRLGASLLPFSQGAL